MGILEVRSLDVLSNTKLAAFWAFGRSQGNRHSRSVEFFFKFNFYSATIFSRNNTNNYVIIIIACWIFNVIRSSEHSCIFNHSQISNILKWIHSALLRHLPSLNDIKASVVNGPVQSGSTILQNGLGPRQRHEGPKNTIE